MSMQVYINFKGNCREAIEFYKEVFELDEPKILTFGQVPSSNGEPFPEEVKNLVMHSELNIFGTLVMVSDVLPHMDLTIGDNITLVLRHNNQDTLRKIFDKLKAGGTVTMELQETFFSKCYGMVKDKFNIGWQLSHQEEIPKE